MRRALVGLIAVLAPATAHADTFEARAQGAVKVKQLDDIVWAVSAACDKGDDTQQRQCRQVRDRKAKALAGATLLVEADAAAFAAGTWNAAKKSVPVSLIGCIRCAGIEVDGKTWFVTSPSPRVEGGKVRGGVLYDNARTFPDEAAATAWTKSLANLRIELVVKLADKRRIQVAGKDGLVLDVVAWRVVSPCDGSIVIASPDAQPVPADKKACAKDATLK